MDLVEIGDGFIRRSDGKAIRLATRPGAFVHDPEHQELFAKVRVNSASYEERARFHELHLALSREILNAMTDELYSITELG